MTDSWPASSVARSGWKPLFYRILYNGIRDLQRRHGVRRRFFGLLPGAARQEEGGGEDPLERVADSAPGPLQQLAADERIVDVHVRRLRTKVELNPNSPELVVTVRGQGYRLDLT